MSMENPREDFYVFAFWGDETKPEKIHVNGLAEAWRVVRERLAKGYKVGLSLALIEYSGAKRHARQGS